MPLPLGHTIIGITTYEVCNKKNSAFSHWKLAIYITVLSSLPDIDVVVGLFFQGNGNAFHRGPTHSLFFALVMGFIASIAYKLWRQIPKISFKSCFLLILSHVLADFLLTSSPVSFFWPFQVTWTTGYNGWVDVMNSIFLQSYQDVKIILWCGIVLIINQLAIRHLSNLTPHNKHL